MRREVGWTIGIIVACSFAWFPFEGTTASSHDEEPVMQSTVDKVGDIMAGWLKAPVPPLVLTGEAAKSLMGPTIGQGGLWPTPEKLRESYVPYDLVIPIHEEAVTWIRRVLRETFVTNDVSDRLVAVRGALQGEDAFLAAWTAEQLPLRVAVTRERIHILSCLLPESVTENPSETGIVRAADRAVALANQILNLPSTIVSTQFRFRFFGGLLVGDIPVTRLQTDWHETLFVLTDGRAVKLSMLKFHKRTSPPKAGSVGGPPKPWFPVP